MTEPDAHFERFAETRKAPVCGCGGYLKPATISFGQSLRAEDLQRAAAAVEKTDLAVALGSTLSVYPAATCLGRSTYPGYEVSETTNQPLASASRAA